MNNIMSQSYGNMVATPHYLASQVGNTILQKGGNAIDASVAISAALGVVYPHMTGLGGDAFFMIYKEGELVGYNGSGRSGSQVTAERFMKQGLGAIPQRGLQSAITVPGMVDAWWEVWSKYGQLPWAELLEPAILYAEQGFPISRDLYKWMKADEALIRNSEALASIFMVNGQLRAPGEKLLQRNLADTLKLIQSDGRDAFYKGRVMNELVTAMKRDGGLLVEADFARHHGDWVEPLSVEYRGYHIYEMPPNSQGFTALMMMNMLEHADFERIPRHSPKFYHLMVEVIKKAFRDRDQHLTDPLFHSIPLERLLSKEYAKELFNDIQQAANQSAVHLSPPMGQDTAYAAVVDKSGNAVSFIQSLYFDFGSCYVPGNTGIVMQNRGSYFSLDLGHVNTLQPGKRSFHTLMPAMICKDGKPYVLFGTQGGEGQPQTQLSIMTGLLDYGFTIQEAITAPRWVYGRTWGTDSDSLRLENRGPQSAAAAQELERWGHCVELVDSWDGMMGQAQGIVIDNNGLRSGAADPRGDGSAIGS